MLRRITCLFTVLAMFSGCAGAPRAKMVGGGVIATTGVVIAAHRASGHCEPQGDTAADVCDALIAEPVNAATDAMTTLLGVGLIALGAGLFIAGVHEENTQESAPTPIARVDTAPATPVRASALPADIALRDRIENRLAIQASLAAHTGNCSAAMVTADALAERDRELHAKLLAVDVELSRCYTTRPAL